MRIKDPEHLLEKIIRKNKDSAGKINISNYKTLITDLIGIRALHLFKKDWKTIHAHIEQTWDLNEKPKANIRDGDDDRLFKEAGCEIVPHSLGYRSVHYLVKSKPSKDIIIAEIQVRTIFEEGWSEVDHKIRYPYETGNTVLEGYLKVFNRLAGNADEMASFIVLLKNEIDNMKQEYETKMQESQETISNLKLAINELEIDQKRKDKILQRINTLLPPNSVGHLSENLPSDRLLSLLSNPLKPKLFITREATLDPSLENE